MLRTGLSLHPFTVWQRAKLRARAERRTGPQTGLARPLAWQEDALFELLRGCTAWDHARVIIHLHEKGLI